MKTMKAMLHDDNGALHWSDVPYPTPKDGEVIVKIRAAALNRADILQRQGQYPSPEGCPPWMGLEIAGEIVEMTDNARQNCAFSVGDRVCALLGGGGYAEFAAVKYDMLMPIPKGLSFEEAASLPEAFATAYLNLFIEGHLTSGQTAFIPAGASGLASVAIPLAKAFGARVITSVRYPNQVETAKKLGADVVIDTSVTPVEAVLAEEEKAGHPVNLAMDCVSGGMIGKAMPFMARGGYWIVIATLAGTSAEIPLRPLLSKGLHLVGSTLRSRDPSFKAFVLSELVNKVWGKIESGELRPHVFAVFPITEADKAHELMLSGKHSGKIVFKVC